MFLKFCYNTKYLAMFIVLLWTSIYFLVFSVERKHFKSTSNDIYVTPIFKNLTLQEPTDDFDILSYQHSTDSSQETPIDLIPLPKEKVTKNKIPTILYWNEYFAKEYKHFVPNKNTKINCPYKCHYTSNKKEYGKTADVRVFHERNLDGNDLPPNNPNAINLYYTLEPPFLTYSKYNTTKVPPNYFNVTGSYRTGSKMFFPYDYFVEIDGTETQKDYWTDEQVEEKLAKKQYPVLVGMSNCKAHSKRHEYVEELKKYLNVTIVGACNGTITCDKDLGDKARRVDTDCMHKLIDEHHFFLAFENSVCPEYVTEKYWRIKDLILPIVLSRAIIPSYIPNDTYIAASDFESPKDLADYLKYLIKNKEEYSKFFSWTKKYRKSRVKEEEIAASCQICKLAYENKKQVIEDYKIFSSKSQECIADYGLNLFKNYKTIKKSEKKLKKWMDKNSRIRSIGQIL